MWGCSQSVGRKPWMQGKNFHALLRLWIEFPCFNILTPDEKDGGDSYPRASRVAHCSHRFNWLWICMWIESWLWRWVCSLTFLFFCVHTGWNWNLTLHYGSACIAYLNPYVDNFMDPLSQKKSEVHTWHTYKLSSFPVIFSIRLCCCSMSEVSQLIIIFFFLKKSWLIFYSYALGLSWKCFPFAWISYNFLNQLWVCLSKIHVLLVNSSSRRITV